MEIEIGLLQFFGAFAKKRVYNTKLRRNIPQCQFWLFYFNILWSDFVNHVRALSYEA